MWSVFFFCSVRYSGNSEHWIRLVTCELEQQKVRCSQSSLLLYITIKKYKKINSLLYCVRWFGVSVCFVRHKLLFEVCITLEGISTMCALWNLQLMCALLCSHLLAWWWSQFHMKSLHNAKHRKKNPLSFREMCILYLHIHSGIAEVVYCYLVIFVLFVCCLYVKTFPLPGHFLALVFVVAVGWSFLASAWILNVVLLHFISVFRRLI